MIESAPFVIKNIFYVKCSHTIKLILFLVLSNGNSAITSNFYNLLFSLYEVYMAMYDDVFSANLIPISLAP
jgi:hypothetical protein